jgi:hypothetical protein
MLENDLIKRKKKFIFLKRIQEFHYLYNII